MKKKHEDGHTIEYYAYVSGLRDWNAGFKVLFSFLVLLLCIVADHLLLSVLVIGSMAWLTMHKGRIAPLTYLHLFAVPLVFMIMSSIAIAISFGSKPAGFVAVNLHWFYLYVSKQSLSSAVYLLLKALGAVSAMYMMILSTPVGEIIAVLKKAHVPQVVIELMNLIYRFIFIMLDVYRMMKHAAVARLGYCDFKTSCYTFGHLAGSLFVISIKQANTYYDALISRCYQGEIQFWQEEKAVTRNQIAAAVFYLLCLMAIWGLMEGLKWNRL